jgi:hypothetical protein
LEEFVYSSQFIGGEVEDLFGHPLVALFLEVLEYSIGALQPQLV